MKKTLSLALVICLVLAAYLPSVMAMENTHKLPPTIERIDPELLPAFESQQPLDFEKNSIKPFREYFASLVDSPDLPYDSAVKVYNVHISGADNQTNLRLRIYEPTVKKDNLAGIYWIHGGGFLFGVPEQDEAQSIRFAKEVGVVVVAVDYRLAPEHPYPAALNDCYAGLIWFAQNSETLGVDKDRIAVAGASAGGGLCASVSLLARDKGGPKLAFQMPLYPMIDDRFITPASREEIDFRVWNATANRYAWQAYIGDLTGSSKVSEYMAPARAADLAGLPPAYSCVGNLDPFRDDTIDYMARLVQAGVPAELHLYPGAYHAFEVIAVDTDYCKRVVDEYVLVLQRALKSVN
ncbi:MAG: alpha/beta hydrolase [Sporomusa sp.]